MVTCVSDAESEDESEDDKSEDDKSEDESNDVVVEDVKRSHSHTISTAPIQLSMSDLHPGGDWQPCGCRRGCMEYYRVPESWAELRKRVSDVKTPRGRHEMADHIWERELLAPHGRDQHTLTKVCGNAAAIILGRRRQWFYWKGAKSTKLRDCPKTISVIAWFNSLLDMADKMPDNDKYQV